MKAQKSRENMTKSTKSVQVNKTGQGNRSASEALRRWQGGEFSNTVPIYSSIAHFAFVILTYLSFLYSVTLSQTFNNMPSFIPIPFYLFSILDVCSNKQQRKHFFLHLARNPNLHVCKSLKPLQEIMPQIL